MTPRKPRERDICLAFGGGTWLNDAHLDSIYGPAVDAVEEAILNAMVAAETVPTFKPPGRLLKAIDTGELMAVMAKYGRPPLR